MIRRLVIDVKPGPAPADAELAKTDDHVWWVTWRGMGRTIWWYTKQPAVAMAREQAKEHHKCGGLAQVVVHTLDGRIAREWTYGNDPPRRKG